MTGPLVRVAGLAEPGGPKSPSLSMPLAHSLHLIVFTLWDADEDAEPETLTYTDGTDARTMYDLLREDPNTRHARLFHNPTPNGGVFDGIRPTPPEPEESSPEGSENPLGGEGDPPDGSEKSPPSAPPPSASGPFAAAAPAAPAPDGPPPPAPPSKPAESPELKLN